MTDRTYERCTAHRKNGDRCKLPPIRGGSVCGSHGGRAPQVRASADERMRRLVHPALDALERLINGNDLGAAKYVLDFAGYKATDKVESSAEQTIRVVFDDMKLAALEPRALGNGLDG